jgi:REP element-mobilizing transposase RayT
MRRAPRQPTLPGFGGINEKEFGGALIRGNPREQRPVSTRRPMHLVLRSSQARGERSFLRPGRARLIERLVRKQAREKGVRIYRFANSGNHLHLLVLPRSRQAYHGFVRAISGLIARLALGAERGRPRQTRGVKFWDARPYTRIVEWGRAFHVACRYVRLNQLEASGFWPYRPRGQARARAKGRATAKSGAAPPPPLPPRG